MSQVYCVKTVSPTSKKIINGLQRIALTCIFTSTENDIYIFDRKLHHKTFLLSVENEFYMFAITGPKKYVRGDWSIVLKYINILIFYLFLAII
jgi:capsule polysaccharide modification protein KpsS